MQKRKKFFRRVMSFGLAALIVGGAAVAELPAVTNDTGITVSAAATKDYVTLKKSWIYYSDDGWGNAWVPVRTPQINLNSSAAKAANKEISKKLTQSNLNKLAARNVDYEYYLNGNILSLVVTITKVKDYNDHLVYNFNVKTGKRLDNRALAKALQLNYSDIKASIKKVINNWFVQAKASGWYFAESQYRQWNRSISDKNIEFAKLYLGNNYKLSTVYRQYLIVGAETDEYITTLNVSSAAKSVKLNKTKATLYAGSSTTLKATVSPAKATNKKVNWSSSNTKVATVKNGKITAKAAGTATITAKTTNGKTAKCKITVKKSYVKLNKTSLTLAKNKTATVKATVVPKGQTATLKWTTSNAKVVTVKNGKLTAKKVGTATITAKTSNGKKATCKVTVKPQPTGIKLSKTSLTLNVGKSSTLKATVSPTNAISKSVKWTSSNTAVASVKNGKVTAKKAGTATITAKTTNGKTAKCKVTVTNLATSVKLSKTSLTLNLGSSSSLTATVTPSNATNKTITWSSSNKNIVTVTNGKITAKKEGTATITAKTSNGKKATCKVTVKDKNSWKELYKEKLKQLLSSNTSQTAFTLYDINKDAIPELIISNGTYHAAKCTVYTVYNSKLSVVGGFGSYGHLMVSDDNQYFCDYYESNGRISESYGVISNGTAKILINFEYSDEEQDFTIDGNSVSESELYSELENYSDYLWQEIGRQYDLRANTIDQAINEWSS